MLTLLAAVAVKAAVTQVTIFSDRARVVRTGEVSIAGRSQVELPLLPESVDPSSLRLEAAGAEVRQLDVQHVEPDEFPAGEARELLAQLEKIDDQLYLLETERAELTQHLEAIRGISPLTKDEPLKPTPRLQPQRWQETIAFVRDEESAVRLRIHQHSVQEDELRRQRKPLVARAKQLGGVERRPGWRVVATLEGQGAAKLTLTYLAGRARWIPGYDLQLLDDQKTVRVSFSGSASQETGEDWESAAMTLSTAIPATARSLPEIFTWKIGEAERFEPHSARSNPPREAQPPPEAPPPEPKPLSSDSLRNELLARADPKHAEEDIVVTGSRVRRKDLISPAPVTATNRAQTAPLAAPPPPKAVAESAAVGDFLQKLPAGAAPHEQPAGFGIAPPPSWRPPQPPPQSAAALAGGNDLIFASLQRETVRSGSGARRVPLFSETWPVTTQRLLVPAVSGDAYLVARIRNPGKRTLPAGEASLSVSGEPSGTATLPLVAPGEELTLPLGLDHSIKSFRNVAQTKSEKGLFSKDDVTRYTVTIEVQNPYSTAIPLRIVDQLPLPGSDKVEVELVEARNAKRDAGTGELTWEVLAPPSGKLKLGFVYDLKRPHGWELQQ